MTRAKRAADDALAAEVIEANAAVDPMPEEVVDAAKALFDQRPTAAAKRRRPDKRP
jgi:hypothetical protein